MKKLKKLFAYLLAVTVMIPSIPQLDLYADKTQIAIGGESVDIIYSTESQKDITMLYPMNVVNVNEGVKLTEDEMKGLLDGDIECTLPHMVMYENLNSSTSVYANQTSEVDYREAVTWLSQHQKLHLPERVTFNYRDLGVKQPSTQTMSAPSDSLYSWKAPEKGKLNNTKTFPFNKGKYILKFHVGKNKFDLTASIEATLNGEPLMTEYNVTNQTITVPFVCDDTSTVTVKVKHQQFYDEETEKTYEAEWSVRFDIDPDVEYPMTRRVNNVAQVVNYKTSYDNVYADPNSKMNKSTFVMNLMKAVDQVRFSRPILVNSAYTKKINGNTSQDLTVEPLEQSLYHTYAKKAGLDFANSQMMVDYTHFGTRLMFTTPNVPELYITEALNRGIISPSELNPTGESTRELFVRHANIIESYSPDAPPVRANYPVKYDPMGIVSGSVVASTRLETLYRLQLIPDHLIFDATLQTISYPEGSYNVASNPYLGASYNYTGKKQVTGLDYISKWLVDTDNLNFLVNETDFKQPVTSISKEVFNSKQPFQNNIASQLKTIEAVNPSKYNYFATENMTFMDAIRLAYDAIKVYSEPTITKLEIDAVNSMFGVQLNEVMEEDKEILQYMFAKGILNPEESSILNLYQPLTNESALELIYRISNEDARYTIKTTLTSTDQQLLDKGYSKVNATKTSTKVDTKQPEPIALEKNQIIYIRLEEIFLKDKDGMAYYGGGDSGITNLDYNPSSYSIDNNIFGLYSSKYHKSLNTFNPKHSPYYLGHEVLNYKSSVDGKNRQVIWLKYNLPPDFKLTGDWKNGMTFNQTGNGKELPTEIKGLQPKAGYYYINTYDKLNYLGVDENFDLRNPSSTVTIKGTGAMNFTYTNKPISTGHPQDKEDIYQLWKHINPNSAERYENGKYNPLNGQQIPDGSGDGTDQLHISQAIEKNTKSATPFSMDLYATTEEDGTQAGNSETAQTGSTSSMPATNVFGFHTDGIQHVRFNNVLLFQTNSAGQVTLNPPAEEALKQDKIKAEIVSGGDGKQAQVKVMFSSSDKAEINLTAYVESSIKVSIPTNGDKVPIGMMYFKFSDGKSTRMLINEQSLATFGIKVFEDSDHNTKVLQNTKTGVYGILSDQTNTCIIGNEFIHFPESAGMIEITDNGIYYNFDIVKKLFSYASMQKIDLDLSTNGLVIIAGDENPVEEISNAKLKYNGVNLGVSPWIYKTKDGKHYLNINSLGYGASYIMKTWKEGDADYTVMTEFVYKEVPEFTSANRISPNSGSSNTPPSVTNPKRPPALYNRWENRPEAMSITPYASAVTDGGGSGNTVVATDNHTLSKANYGKYDEMLTQHYESIFEKSDEARKRLALTNLAVHWTLYDSAKLPARIEQNYINNPYTVPKFTLFKNGQPVVATQEAEILNKMYNEFDTVAGITDFGTTDYSTGTFTFGDILKDKDYFEKTFVQDTRDWKYDKIKKAYLLGLDRSSGTTPTVGEVKFFYDKGSNVLGMYSVTNHVGYANGEIPVYANVVNSGEGTEFYYVGSTPYRINGPNILVDSKGAQYVYLGLAPPVAQLDVNLSDITSSMDGDYIKDKFKNNEIYSKIKHPYSEYPYTVDTIKSNKVPFLEGDKNPESLKTMFVNSIGNTSSLSLDKVGSETDKIILLRHSDLTLKPHYYYGTTSGSDAKGAHKPIVSKNALTKAQVDKLIKAGSAEIYIQYNLLTGITDLAYHKDDATKTLQFAGPKVYYTEQISPVMDVATIIAKELISSASSYEHKTNGNGTNSTFKKPDGTFTPFYMKDLKIGDAVLFNDYNNLRIMDVAVVTQEPKAKAFVPVTSMFISPKSRMFSPYEVLNEGRTNILINQMVTQRVFLPGGTKMPVSKLTNIESLQVANNSDFTNYMAFYNALGVTPPKSTDSKDLKSNYKSVFSKGNKDILSYIKSNMSDELNSTTLSFLVQVGDNNTGTELNMYNYSDGWKDTKGKDLTDDSYTKSAYSYLARYDIYPYAELEWVADYTVSPDDSETRSIYRIVGVNTTQGQNVGAYSSYANYLKTDYQNVDIIMGKKKLWDNFYLSADMLTADDLDIYINSQFPEHDKRKNNDRWSQFYASNLFSAIILTLQVIMLTWGLLLFGIYTMCKFQLGKYVVHKFKLLRILTFNRQQSPYTLNLKKCFIYTLLYLGVVTTIFYSGTWELLGRATTTISTIYQDLYDYFDIIANQF